MHHRRYLQAPHQKNFIPFPVFTLKNCLYIGNCHLPPFCLFLVHYLVDNQLVAAHTKSQNFPEITQIQIAFYSILLKK